MSNPSRVEARLTMGSQERMAAAATTTLMTDKQPHWVGLFHSCSRPPRDRLLLPGKGCLPADVCTRVGASVCLHTHTHIHSFKVPTALEAKTTRVLMYRSCLHVAVDVAECLQ